jgi:hypothetical protein
MCKVRIVDPELWGDLPSTLEVLLGGTALVDETGDALVTETGETIVYL